MVNPYKYDEFNMVLDDGREVSIEITDYEVETFTSDQPQWAVQCKVIGEEGEIDYDSLNYSQWVDIQDECGVYLDKKSGYEAANGF